MNQPLLNLQMNKTQQLVLFLGPFAFKRCSRDKCLGEAFRGLEVKSLPLSSKRVGGGLRGVKGEKGGHLSLHLSLSVFLSPQADKKKKKEGWG